MRLLWPSERAGELGEADLERLYAYPPDRDWLVMNFVASADGAVEHGGRAQALSNQPDQDVLRLGSDLADALLVGATTAMVEQFRGQHPDGTTARRRHRHGLAPVAPTVVVTTGSLPSDADVLTQARIPSIVATTAEGAEALGHAWRASGAEVWVCGERVIDLRVVRTRLSERGLRRVDCEGGHTMFGALLSAGLVDELRLTLSPLLVAGQAARIATGSELSAPAPLRLDSVLTADDTLLLRYLTRPNG